MKKFENFKWEFDEEEFDNELIGNISSNLSNYDKYMGYRVKIRKDSNIIIQNLKT